MSQRRATPRYVTIADALRSRILADRSGESRRLPSEHALCSEFGVSRMTVRQALDALRQEGLLSRQVGRGTFTTPIASERPLRVIGSVDDMLALGDETWFKPLEKGVGPAPAEVARALRLRPGAPVARFAGVRHGDDGPFQHVTAYLLEAVGRRLLDEDLSSTSVIGAVERHLGISAVYVEQAIEVMRCPKPTAELLDAPAGAPILRFRRTYFTAGGDPIEHAVTFHWTPRYPYTMMLFRSDKASPR